MNDEELEDEYDKIRNEIEIAKENLNENERTLIDEWLSQLSDFTDDDDKNLKTEYLRFLRDQVYRPDRHLSSPYLQNPPETALPPLEELLNASRGLAEVPPPTPTVERRRYLCSATGQKPPRHQRSVPPKIPDGTKRAEENEFEDPEVTAHLLVKIVTPWLTTSKEMAKCITRSKGMTLAEFVADISRHTADKGHELRAAMKTEVAAFTEYVERIMTQRIKDLGELLDDKQSQELLRIQRDYDKWQSELSLCKAELKAIVPDFDIDSYRRDRSYLRKFFTVSASNPPAEDKLKEWKEGNCFRLMWFINEINKLTEENNQVLEQTSLIKAKTSELEEKESQKQQCHVKSIHAENEKYKILKQKSDKLGRKITDLLMSSEN